MICARMPSTRSCERAEADRHPIVLHQNIFQRFQLGGAAYCLQRDRHRDGGAAGDQVGGVLRRSRVMAAQRGDDVFDGVAGEALVDPITLCGKFTRWRFDGVMGQRARDAVVGDRRGERVEVAVRHVVVGESHCDGVGAGERCTGQGGVQTQRAGCPGEQIRPADVGDEPDADLGHGDLGGIGHHPGVRVRADADAAAHHDAVHHRHQGFGEPADLGVEQILVAPEPSRFDSVRVGAVVDRHHVAAGAQSAFPGSGEHHRLDRVVAFPSDQHGAQQLHHRLVERVDRLRAIERDEADAAVDTRQDLVGFPGHGLSHT